MEMATQQVIFFDKFDPTTGDELWATDGSNTWLVKDVNPGVGGSNPIDLTEFNGTLSFFGYDSTNGYQLWTSDGTAAGTVRLSNFTATDPQYFASLNAPSSFEINSSLPIANNKEFFVNVADNSGPLQLWASDGTAGGTAMVLSTNQPINLSGLFGLTPVGNKLFFQEYDNTLPSDELWTTDGTAAGTLMLAAPVPGFSSGVDFNGDFYFSGPGTIWKSDGTIAGTVEISSSLGGSSLTPVGNELFFASGNQLWKTDGTGAGTALIANINVPQNLTNFNGTLFFVENDGFHGYQLWKSDGTAAGTVRVTDVNPAAGGFGNPTNQIGRPSDLTVVGNELFFVASDGFEGQQLWKTDGTTAGTVMVTDVFKDVFSEEGQLSSPTNLIDANGVLYFDANDGTGNALWKSDGTAAGTVKVADFVDPDNPMAVVTLPVVTPTVGVSGASSTLKAGQTDLITFTFNEPVTGFDHADVNVSGGTLGAISQIDPTHYTATFTPAAGVNTQTATIQVAASGTGNSSWTDLAGHTGTASNAFAITEDTQQPTVGVSGASSTLQPGQTDLITFTFNEPVTGFDHADVNVSGGTLGAISQADTTHYSAIFTAGVNTPTATIQVAASGTGNSSWTDLAGNAGAASNTFAITEGNPFGLASSANTFGFAASSNTPAVTQTIQSLAIVAGPNDSFNFGAMGDAIGFAPNQNMVDNLNTLHGAVQPVQAELANLQQSAAAAVSTHDALGLVTPPDVHAANLYADAFHLV
jgi:ELWxxDGT repeat protein